MLHQLYLTPCTCRTLLAYSAPHPPSSWSRGVTPIGAVSRAATEVKIQSNSQGTWGSVKWYSGPYLQHSYIDGQDAWRDFLCMRSSSMVNGSRAKIRRGQAVKAFLEGQKSWHWLQLWIQRLWEWPPLLMHILPVIYPVHVSSYIRVWIPYLFEY